MKKILKADAYVDAVAECATQEVGDAPPAAENALNEYVESAANAPGVLKFAAVRYQPAAAGKFKLKTLADVLSAPSSSWLVKNVLPSTGVSIVYGATQAGKTFVICDLAAHILRGTAWCGHRVKKGRVLYVAMEGGAGVANRFRALMKHRDLAVDADCSPSGPSGQIELIA